MRVMLDAGAFKPTRAHESDAGFDLYSPVDTVVRPYIGTVIDTGVHAEIPKGYCGLVKSRSGMNIHKDLICEGVIDSGYTGSIVVKLRNAVGESRGDWREIHRGDRIAQLVIVPVFTPDIEVVRELAETERGENGFGSTGV
ncbi:MAG: dUTP diphosphatase [Christensenellaceae bacterium]|nr:dUTP diphosphatase [Christensenellaceae bacterium]